MSFPPRADSVRLARSFISRQLTDAGLDGAAFTASLLVSELVTNAVLHARTECRVEVDFQGAVVRVAVSDESSRPVLRRRHTIESGTGRGLLLVEQMSRAWGIEPRQGGKSVWFEISDEVPVDEGEPDLDAFLTLDEDLAREHG